MKKCIKGICIFVAGWLSAEAFWTARELKYPGCFNASVKKTDRLVGSWFN